MASNRIAVAVAAAAFFVAVQASALAQGTQQQREACTPDAFRLCGAYMPDPDGVAACLRGNGPRLSSACYDVFFPAQDMPTRSVSPRRRSNNPPRPQDDDED